MVVGLATGSDGGDNGVGIVLFCNGGGSDDNDIGDDSMWLVKMSVVTL